MTTSAHFSKCWLHYLTLIGLGDSLMILSACWKYDWLSIVEKVNELKRLYMIDCQIDRFGNCFYRGDVAYF